MENETITEQLQTNISEEDLNKIVAEEARKIEEKLIESLKKQRKRTSREDYNKKRREDYANNVNGVRDKQKLARKRRAEKIKGIANSEIENIENSNL